MFDDLRNIEDMLSKCSDIPAEELDKLLDSIHLMFNYKMDEEFENETWKKIFYYVNLDNMKCGSIPPQQRDNFIISYIRWKLGMK